jgi:ssDNA-binding Zn-finger/Zn-ribbon topoisomerase 1
MRIVCKDCKKVLIDTENGVSDYRIYTEIFIKPEISKWIDVESLKFYVMCPNCGRKIEKEKLDKLGVRIKLWESDRGEEYG